MDYHEISVIRDGLSQFPDFSAYASDSRGNIVESITMEPTPRLLDRTEIPEEPERKRAIQDVQAKITDLITQATNEDRHSIGSQFSVFVETPFLPGTVMVGRDLDPSKEPHYGIEWEYEIYVVYPQETGIGEPTHINIYYLITTDDDLVRLDIDERKYMSSPSLEDLMGAKDRSELLDFVDQDVEAHNRMDFLVREEIKEKKNGMPVPLEDIRALITILGEANLVNTSRQKSA